MIDYKVIYNTFYNDVQVQSEIVITIEEEYIEDQEILEDVLLEKAKECLECKNIEIVEFEELTQIEQANLYKITAEDVYCNDEYMYKGDINEKVKKFIGKDIESSLNCIKTTLDKINY